MLRSPASATQVSERKSLVKPLLPAGWGAEPGATQSIPAQPRILGSRLQGCSELGEAAEARLSKQHSGRGAPAGTAGACAAWLALPRSTAQIYGMEAEEREVCCSPALSRGPGRGRQSECPYGKPGSNAHR